VSAYLIWQRRAELRTDGSRGSIWGYVVLVFGLILLILGQAATFGYPARLSLIIVLSGLILFMAGSTVLRRLGFPLAYLLFMVPLPVLLLNQIAFPLQLLAAKLATGALDILNIPVLREGDIITLPFVRLEVVEACSGIRSIVSLLALAVIFAYFTQRGWVARVGLTLSAIPIALLTNAARIALSGILVQTIGPRMALGFYHTFSGLLIFALAFGLLALEALIIRRISGGEPVAVRT
jgi:exosortase